MKEISMKLSEISESREVMESKPYPIVTYFIYILLIFFTISLMWMYFTELDIVVKGTGIVRPIGGVSVVKNKITGKIKEKNLSEGKVVNKGDTLFIINHEDLKSTKKLLISEISLEKEELINLKKYKESILTKENLFDKENEKEYYYKYIGFSENLVSLKETINSNKNQLKDINSKLKGLKLLKESIEVGESKFSNNSTYALRFNEYKLKTKELNQKLKEMRKKHENNNSLFKEGAISENTLNLSESNLNNAELQLSQYINSLNNTLKKEENDLNLKIEDLNSNLNKLAGGSDSYKDNLPIETKEIIKIDEQIKTKEKNLRSLEKELENTKMNIEKCIIKAETKGVINLKKKISVGDYLSGGEIIANVIPKGNKEYNVEISMPEREISNIEIGDTIKYRFNSLPYKEYGMLKGKVKTISEDSVFNKERGTNSFIIRAEVDNKPLYSYKGEKANLKVGMTCEAQVITKSKKTLFYLLEKIDLLE